MSKCIYGCLFILNFIPWILLWFLPSLYRSYDIEGTLFNMFIIELIFLILSILFNIFILIFEQANTLKNKRLLLMIANTPIIFLLGFGQISPIAFYLYELINNQVIVFILSGIVHLLLYFLFLKIILK